MFYLQGLKESVRTLMLLTSDGQSLPSGIDDMRARYIDFAVSVGGEEMRPAKPDGQFCYDPHRIDRLASKYAKITHPREIPYADQARHMSCIAEGKAKIRKVNPDLDDYFDMVIHTLFYQETEEAFGGSTSKAPGVIWCAPRENWSTDDAAEFLVHELTHNALALDERVHRHYHAPDALSHPGFFAVSSILGRPRPLDRAFHSLVVTHEVLSFRIENGEPIGSLLHASSNEMLAASVATIESIWQVLDQGPHLVAPRFTEVLERVEKSLSSMRRA